MVSWRWFSLLHYRLRNYASKMSTPAVRLVQSAPQPEVRASTMRYGGEGDNGDGHDGDGDGDGDCDGGSDGDNGGSDGDKDGDEEGGHGDGDGDGDDGDGDGGGDGDLYYAVPSVCTCCIEY